LSQLGAVVADDHARIAAQFSDPIELAGDAQPGERRVHDQAQAFSGEVVDQRQDTEAPAADQCVGHEVERPAQIATLRYRHRCPGAESPLATATLAHGQPFLLVEPIELLAIELDALALQHQTETPIAEPPSLGRQLPQPLAQIFIATPL